MGTDDDRATNRRWWDERAELHPTSPMYTPWLDALRRGEPCLFPEERALVGDCRGQRLLHLPCHIGHDTLSWALLGAEVTGVDFSPPALAQAERLATELGLSATWQAADVASLPEAWSGRFDVVVSTYGVLGWIADLTPFFAEVARVLAPGGRFVVIDGHPLYLALDPGSVTGPEGPYVVHEPVMGGGRVTWSTRGSYADPDAATTHDDLVGWCHGLGDILGGVLAAGLSVEHFAEHDHCVWQGLPHMIRRDDGTFRLPPPMHGQIPCMFSLTGRKAARP